MKDPPPGIFSACRSVTLPSLKSVEIHQAGNRRTKRPIAPSFEHYYPKIVDENRIVHFSLLSASLSPVREALFDF